MRNPFKSIGSAITGAGKAIGGAITGAGKAITSTTTRATKAVAKVVTAPFQRKEKVPKTSPKAPPPAPKETPKAPPPAPKETPKAPPTGGIISGGEGAPPAKKRKLPPTDYGPGGPSVGSGGSGIARDVARDDKILGTDSDPERELLQAIKDFEADHKISILGDNAKGFIEHPTFSAIFDKYSVGSGWSSDQWFKGANNIRDIQITKKPGGKIEITFDADVIIDNDYDIGARTVTAVF